MNCLIVRVQLQQRGACEEADPAEVLLVLKQNMAFHLFCGAVPRMTLGAEILDILVPSCLLFCPAVMNRLDV